MKYNNKTMEKINAQQLIAHVEQKQMKTDIPHFIPGDTVAVSQKLTENNRTRIQKFEGTVIAMQGRGLNRKFTVRKDADGIGVERTYTMHSTMISKIEVLKQGRVRRAKIFYLRQRKGKSAKIKSRTFTSTAN
jgi:large subunit ribosomal protein L19